MVAAYTKAAYIQMCRCIPILITTKEAYMVAAYTKASYIQMCRCIPILITTKAACMVDYNQGSLYMRVFDVCCISTQHQYVSMQHQ